MTYEASGAIPQGQQFRVKQTCGGENRDYNTDAEGTWLMIPGDEQFTLTGGVLNGTWLYQGGDGTTFTWTLTRVK